MSSPGSSRPASRAQSDVSWATATEVPESPSAPRTVTEQIDHIKSLVTRMHGTTRTPEGAITAQLFRNRRRSNSHEPVSQAQILHILDSLKRRIRQEQQLHRRPSEIDPETESEGGSPIDEREEELADIREELAHERSQREEWLESAEARVDNLMVEKEDVDNKLAETQAVVEEVQSERDELRRRLSESEEQSKKLQNTLKDAQRQIDDLRVENTRHKASFTDVSSQLSVLQRLRAESEASTLRDQGKIATLEQKNIDLEKQIQTLRSERDTVTGSAQQRYAELQDQHYKLKNEYSSALDRATELERNVGEADTRIQTLDIQLDKHKTLLADGQKDADLHEKEMHHLLSEHENVKREVEVARSERDELMTKYEALVESNKEGDEQAMRALQEAQAEHKEVLERQSKASEDELRRVKAEHEDVLKQQSEASHSEFQKADAEHQETMKRQSEESQAERRKLNAEQEETLRQQIDRSQAELQRTKEGHDEAMSRQIEDSEVVLQQTKVDHENKLKQLEEESENKVRQAMEAHAATLKQDGERWQSELQRIRTTHENAMKALEDERSAATATSTKKYDDLLAQHDALKKEHEGLVQKMEAKLDDLRTQHEDTLRSSTDQNAVQVTLAQRALDQLQMKHDAYVAGRDAEKQSLEKQIETLKTEHGLALHSMRDESQASLTESTTAKEREIADLHHAHLEEVERLKSSASYQQSLAQQSEPKFKTDIAELQSHITMLEGSHKDVQDRLSNKAKEHDDFVQASRKTQTDLESLVQDLQKRANAAEESTRVREATLNDSLTAKESELTDTRIQLSELQQKLEGLSSNLEKKSHELTEANSRYEASVKDLESSWTAKADEAAKSHQAELENASQEASRALDNHKKQLEQYESAADSELNFARQESATKLAKVRKELDDQVAAAKSSATDREQKMKAMTEEHEEHIGQLRKDHEESVRQLSTEHEARVSELQSNLDQSREDSKRDLEAQLADRDNMLTSTKASHSDALAELRQDLEQRILDGEERLKSREAQHDKAVAQMRSEHETYIADHEQRLKSALAQHEDALLQLRKDHESRTATMQIQFEEAHQASKQSFEAQLVAAESASTARSADMEAQRQRTLSDSSSKYQAELKSLRKSHEDSTNELLRKISGLEARLEKTGTDHAQTLSDKEELEYKISQLRSNHEQALQRVSNEHDQLLAAAGAKSERQLDERLQAQSEIHGQEFDRLQESLNGELQNLQIQLEEAAELRQKQMQAADTERERALGGLNERLTSAQETATALQGRLDAELTSRAEVERALAEMRRQRLEDDRKASESREELMQQIAALQVERDVYAKRAAVVSNSLSTDTSQDTDDVSVLKQRLAVAQAELHDMKQSNGKGTMANGDSELARQNEFLATQLEAMVATRSTPVTPIVPRSDPFEGRVDADTQTEPVAVMTESERTRLESRKRTPAVNTVMISKPRDQNQFMPSPKTPEQSMTQQRNPDRSWKTRSFEDYLQQAQAELSELGSVISQNEALFAQKIQEHVGDLQRAKDQMAAEYKEKFDALLSERENMEKRITSQSAQEFAKERQRLVETYGAYHDEPAKQAAAITNLSTPQRNALRDAEEKLVNQHTQRVVKRKSQIAMKHAEDFQSLTQDYDRRLADLLGNRDKLGGDLSMDPDRFEKDFGELETMSAQLENERAGSSHGSPHVGRFIASAFEGAQSTRATQPSDKPQAINFSKSQLPKRTSTPRTPTSIPRAVPYQGNRSSSDAQRKRQSMDVQRSFTERLPHIRQQSSALAKSPIEEHGPTTMPSVSRGSRRMSSQPVPAVTSQDFGIDPVEYEQLDASNNKSPDLPRSSFSKRKSTRLSSGIMYSGWQNRDF